MPPRSVPSDSGGEEDPPFDALPAKVQQLLEYIVGRAVAVGKFQMHPGYVACTKDDIQLNLTRGLSDMRVEVAVAQGGDSAARQLLREFNGQIGKPANPRDDDGKWDLEEDVAEAVEQALVDGTFVLLYNFTN